MIYSPPPGPPPPTVKYAPPPGPPPSSHRDPLPLIPTSSPVPDLQSFADRGWATLDLTTHPTLAQSFTTIFSISQHFFALDDSSKQPWKASSAKQASELGWSRVEGEKQILTLRSCKSTPPELLSAATEAWKEVGELLAELARSIARSLGLPEDAFSGMIDPCIAIPQTKGSASLLRLFRYDRPPPREPIQVVAQPHRDLGLLTLVVGHSPGLDVWERDPTISDPTRGHWIAIESQGRTDDHKGMMASVLIGQTMSFLTQGRYRPGHHRVSVAAASESSALDENPEAAFRYSTVFALRPHPVTLRVSDFESPITGPFLSSESVLDAGELFRSISNQAWNINISKEVREEQKKRLQEQKMKLMGEEITA